MPSAAVEALYTASFGHLTDIALSNEHVTPEDAYDVLRGLAKHLNNYSGPLEQEAFIQWAEDIIAPAVFLHGLIRQCRKPVRFALRRTLCDAYDDQPEVVNELEGEVWLWAMANLEALQTPGTAALSSRLFARACWTARAWNKKQLLRFSAISRKVERDGALGQIEHFSEAELAELRAREEAA